MYGPLPHIPIGVSDRRRPHVLLCPVLALVLLLAGGCAYPKPVPTYEMVVEYDRMTDRFDPLVSLVYAPDVSAIARYRNFIVGEVEPGMNWPGGSRQVERYAAFFRHVLQQELLRTRRFTFVSLDPQARFLTPALVLRAKITRFSMGSGVLRYLSGLLFVLQPLGATDFQIEGRISDARTGAVLLEFVDRRRHLGNTNWGPNPRTLRNDFVMKITVSQTARCLAKFIASVHAGLPPN